MISELECSRFLKFVLEFESFLSESSSKSVYFENPKSLIAGLITDDKALIQSSLYTIKDAPSQTKDDSLKKQLLYSFKNVLQKKNSRSVAALKTRGLSK